jgi:hypothetical protein
MHACILTGTVQWRGSGRRSSLCAQQPSTKHKQQSAFSQHVGLRVLRAVVGWGSLCGGERTVQDSNRREISSHETVKSVFYKKGPPALLAATLSLRVLLVVAMLVDGKRMRTIWIESGGEVSVIDQRELPHNLVTRTIATHEVRCRLLFRVRGVLVCGTTTM